jgi:HK97 family phage major capsid protein
MLGTNIFGNQVGLLRLTELDPNRVGTPLTIYPHAINAFSSKNISRPSMSLMVVHTYWDGTGTKPEGTTSGQSNFSFKTVEFKTFNIATFFGLSDETLDDMDETLDEISVTAPSKILDKIDSKVFADAGDNSTDIRGLFVNGETCTDFVASTYATTVLGANMVDLIAKMKLAISKNKYKANRVCLNPSDVDNIQCLKDQLDNSITDRRLVFNMNGELVKIAGLEIVQSEFITENTCLVCDSAQVWFGIRKGLTMEIGLNGTDFVEGQKTVRFGTRLALGVKDKAALQYSVNMATDLTTITKTGA